MVEELLMPAELDENEDAPTSLTEALEQFSKAIAKSLKSLDVADKAVQRLCVVARRKVNHQLRLVTQVPPKIASQEEDDDDDADDKVV